MTRCTAKTKGGQQCKASAIVGSKICIFHSTQQSVKRMDRAYRKSMRRTEINLNRRTRRK